MEDILCGLDTEPGCCKWKARKYAMERVSTISDLSGEVLGKERAYTRLGRNMTKTFSTYLLHLIFNLSSIYHFNVVRF